MIVLIVMFILALHDAFFQALKTSFHVFCTYSLRSDLTKNTYVSNIRTGRFDQYIEIIADYCDNLVKHIHELCGKMHRVLVGKPEGKRPLGRPRRRWLGNIRTDLQEVGCGYIDWIGLAQDRDRWRTLVSAVMNLRVP